MMNILFKNLHIVSPLDNINGNYDLLIVDGIIENIGKNLIIDGVNSKVIDADELTCVPGLFDIHVHFRDPGQQEKEDLMSGCNAAKNGGFTGVLCMPNTIPAIDNEDVINYLNDKSKENLVDVYLSCCVSKDREGKELADLKTLYKIGAKAFTDDGSPVYNAGLLRDALKFSSEFNVPVLQHSEDKELMNDGVINEGETSKKLFLKGIPSISETTIIARDCLINDSTKNSKYHIQHISCRESLEVVRFFKKRGDYVTCEVCPHHFILTEMDVEKYGTNAKMNPPLRTNRDVKSILNGINDNTIDIICSDHAPHTKEDKLKKIETAPFGIIGLETSVGLSYTFLVKSGIITLEKLIEKMSINPRKLLNLDEIYIKKGERANLTILDTNMEWTVDKNKFKSKSRNTPFDKFKLYCKPFAVINNNQIYYSNL
jgi:dihydroorotase